MNIKPEILVVLLALLLASAGSVNSVTRTISNTNDNLYTFIRNSNGKYWHAISTNIQIAINDLNNKSGTVWLPGCKTFYLDKTVVVHKNIVLDMGGSSFKLPNGVNTNVVELKDGAGIMNGVIDVAGHQTYPLKNGQYWTNSSFMTPSAAIFLNASSIINSASIDRMYLDSISDGYNNVGYYSSNYSGSGYGIYLHATNTNVPQRISNISVKHVYFRSFKIGVYIHNERNPVGNENGAYIEKNTFENLAFSCVSWGINITRITSTPKSKCSVSYNHFNQIQFQTGRGSYYAGQKITWSAIRVNGGTGNSFKNMMLWDYRNFHIGSGPALSFSSDTDNCYFNGRAFADDFFSNNGTNNTIFLNGNNDVNLYIGKVYELFE